MQVVESVVYEVERSINERIKNIKSEFGFTDIENRLASTNIMLKKISSEMTPVNDKGITVNHLLQLDSVAKRVAQLESTFSVGSNFANSSNTDKSSNIKVERMLSEMVYTWVESFKV